MKPVQTDYLPTTFSAEKLRSERVTTMAGMPTNILDEGGLRLARCDFDGVFNADAEANARRFIACWNAMIGIPDPELWRAKMDKAESTVAEMKEELNGVRQRLGNAVDALRDSLRYLNGKVMFGLPDDAVAAFNRGHFIVAHHDAGIPK